MGLYEVPLFMFLWGFGMWTMLDNFHMCINRSVSVACLTIFVNCFVKQFAVFIGVVVIWMLHVMELLSMRGGRCAVQ